MRILLDFLRFPQLNGEKGLNIEKKFTKLCVIICIYGDVFPAQIAPVTKVLIFSDAKIDGDSVFFLTNNVGYNFCIKIGWFSITKDENVTNFT